ncbi:MULTISPECIES: hypothetical protein [Clostridium]|uniref:Uncharacterized protein n=1 Tax=Clostridium aquiflavi TaxID=3073603 RepID=A0ABU1EI02_9CLOT|nr:MULTISPECIES: hypothetical protein [unclassified Clostridium]MDR5587990.1 hypothetical protein [Clostridium sp. 5N-1]NFG61753.1 hypothetical protein [Clostridium botulinum]NFQ08538.1 hypothetical protein [Clostridium botulinum]
MIRNNKKTNSNNINKSDIKFKHTNEYNENNNDSSTNQTEDTTSDINIPELLEQLKIINLSINALFVIIIAILQNMDFLFWQRAKLIDKINGTNYAENLLDKTDNPKNANMLNIYASAVFLCINWEQFQKISSTSKDKKEITRAYDSFISSLLIFIAALISRYTFIP